MSLETARHLEASHIAHHHFWGSPQDTLERIQAIEDEEQRSISLALHRLAGNDPAAARNLLNQMLEETGVQFLQAGVESSVYAKGDVVMKTDRNAQPKSPERLYLQLQLRHAQVERTKKGLGHFVLAPLEMTIDAHPAYQTPQAVVTTQPRLAVDTRFNFFYAGEEELALAEEVYPGISDELLEFIRRSERWMEASDEMPDTNGGFNIVIGTLPEAATPELYLVDLSPLPQSDELSYELVSHQLATTKAILLDQANAQSPASPLGAAQ